MPLCDKCGSELTGPFCANCGTPQELRRIDWKYISTEIGSVLHFDKGILYSIRELSIRPGKSIRHFLLHDRHRLVKPIFFILVCSLIYSVVQQLVHFEDGYVGYNFDDWKGLAIGHIFTWIGENYGYANILMALFIGFWIKILFRKYGYNFYEIVVLLCFVMGMTMLLYTLFGLVEVLTGWPALQIGANLSFIYCSWAIGQFFDGRKKRNYLKGLLSYVFGMISFIVAAAALGLSIDKLLA
ncbi:DUF3667 domain-containing protein [bacterium SCSIO 12741]|nr:DUF3667 domain-containing protein [bacterium SCSIO 12741]